MTYTATSYQHCCRVLTRKAGLALALRFRLQGRASEDREQARIEPSNRKPHFPNLRSRPSKHPARHLLAVEIPEVNHHARHVCDLLQVPLLLLCYKVCSPNLIIPSP